MLSARKIGIAFLFWLASLPMCAGTGRPRDGFLSFILLFAFLVLILGILQLANFVKKKIRELLEDLF